MKIISKQQFSSIERTVFFNEYQERCNYCGKNVTLLEMKIDHIIPERVLLHPKSPGEYCLWKEKYSLLPEFNIRGYENLCCSCDRCNIEKRDRGLDELDARMNSQILQALNRASGLVATIRTLVEAKKRSRRRGITLNQIGVELELERISLEELKALRGLRIEFLKEKKDVFLKRNKGLDKIFVKPSKYDMIVRTLLEKKFIIITGLQGIGKTCLSNFIGLHFEGMGYLIHNITRLDEFFSVDSEKQLTIFNDPFGENVLDAIMLKEWNEKWNDVNDSLDENHLIIITTPKFIYEREKEGIAGNEAFEEVYLEYENEPSSFKLKIVRNNIQKMLEGKEQTEFTKRIQLIQSFESDIRDHVPFSPQSIHFLFNAIIPRMDEDIDKDVFFNQISSFLKTNFTGIKMELLQLHEPELLILLILHSQGQGVELDWIRYKYEKICSLFKIIATNLDSALKFLCQVYIDCIYRFEITLDHPTIKKILDELIMENPDLVRKTLLIGGPTFLRLVFSKPSSTTVEKRAILGSISYCKTIREIIAFVREIQVLLEKEGMAHEVITYIIEILEKPEFPASFEEKSIPFNIISKLSQIPLLTQRILDISWKDDLICAVFKDILDGTQDSVYEFIDTMKDYEDDLRKGLFAYSIQHNEKIVERISTLVDEEKRVILSEYTPLKMIFFNDVLEILNEILPDRFQKYDDTREKEDYNERYWSAWIPGADYYSPPAIDGGTAQLRITCPNCRTIMVTDTIEITRPIMHEDKSADSETFSEDLYHSCVCGREFKIYTGSCHDSIWIYNNFPNENYSIRFFNWEKYNYDWEGFHQEYFHR